MLEGYLLRIQTRIVIRGEEERETGNAGCFGRRFLDRGYGSDFMNE